MERAERPREGPEPGLAAGTVNLVVGAVSCDMATISTRAQPRAVAATNGVSGIAP